MLRAVLAALVISQGCTAPAVSGQRVELPALRCSLTVPTDARVTRIDDGVDVTLRPGGRIAPGFTLRAGAPARPGEVQRVLAPDVTVRYTLTANDGGSGGAQSELVGGLQVGGREFTVHCLDQDEWPGEPDARWCLPWLATLRVDAGPASSEVTEDRPHEPAHAALLQ